MQIFDVQDAKIVFDAEPYFVANPQHQMEWRDLFEKDLNSFIRFLRVSAGNSNILKFILGCTSIERKQGYKNILSAAMSGYSPAAFLLSYLHEYGEMGCAKDKIISDKFLFLAASLGHPHALWVVGTSEYCRDKKNGMRLILISALSGFTPAAEYVRENSIFGEATNDICSLFENKYGY